MSGWIPFEMAVPVNPQDGGRIASDFGASLGAIILVPRPATIYSVSVANDTGSTVYVQLHNKVTAPALNDVPIWVPVKLFTASSFQASPLPQTIGLYCSVGIAIGLSTTRVTFTSVANGTYTVSVIYRD